LPQAPSRLTAGHQRATSSSRPARPRAARGAASAQLPARLRDAAIGSISGVNGVLAEANALQLGSATSSAGDVVLRAAGAAASMKHAPATTSFIEAATRHRSGRRLRGRRG
jgi:hypothetical protein